MQLAVAVGRSVPRPGSQAAIIINANRLGSDTPGYTQAAAAVLSTGSDTSGNRITITANAGGGTGDVVLGDVNVGSTTASVGGLVITANGGNIVWNPAFTVPIRYSQSAGPQAPGQKLYAQWQEDWLGIAKAGDQCDGR